MTTNHSAYARVNAAAAVALACCICATCHVAECAEPKVLVIKVGRILTVRGDVIDNGSVLIRDGRIEAVARDIAVPSAARVIERASGVLTPGLIDACCVVDSEIAQGAATWSHSPTRASLWQALADRALREHDASDDQSDPG